MAERFEIAILGAGIAGCALAYHLVERRVGPVAVLDPRSEAAGATGRSAGVLTRQLWDRWDTELAGETETEYERLCAADAPGAFRRNGFLRFTHRPATASALRGADRRLRNWGLRTELLDARAAQERLPEVSFGPEAVALDSPGDACVDATAVTGLYARRARATGARFELGAPIALRPADEGGWALSVGPEELRARRVVLAAGAWTKWIARSIGLELPLCPYRTQAALLRPDRPTDRGMRTGHDLDTDVYLRPEDGGRVLAGDGTELTEADPERFPAGADPVFLARLAEVLSERWPGFATAQVTAGWAGLCTATPDRRPLIGPAPALAGAFLLTGFNGFGVMRAGAAARRLAAALAGDTPEEEWRRSLGPALPGRFRGPQPEFLPRPGFTLEGGPDPRY